MAAETRPAPDGEPSPAEHVVSEKDSPSEPAANNEPSQSQSKPEASKESPEPTQSGNPPPAKSDPAKSSQDSKKPAGGYDATPYENIAPGYTVKFTFHRASALPMADFHSASSDPYFTAHLSTDLAPRHKEDPPMTYRSRVLWNTKNPEWEEDWVVAGIPASGFKLKIRIFDEDLRHRDDRLGNVSFTISDIFEGWEGIRHQPFKIKKRMASKPAYLFRAVAVCLGQAEEMSGRMQVSVKVLGRSDPEHCGRTYTVEPCHWSKHFSPLLGRIAHSRDDAGGEEDQAGAAVGPYKNKKRTKRANFEANQLQLQGPVPSELYHRYVEFRPWIKSMYSAKGFRGLMLNKALHYQHAHVYNHAKMTIYGSLPGPSNDMTLKFLDFVHYAQGGRIFTYIITLDGQWRFTETGKEFGIDMLSKHTMHSNVSTYIAYSGEFFIRRLPHEHHHDGDSGSSPATSPSSSSSPPPQHPSTTSSAPTTESPETPPVKDPTKYQLVIDNDSGTYRPNAALLPILKSFLAHNLPGLDIVTLDCQADADKMAKLKEQHREAKKHADGGQLMVFTQLDRHGSFSSSDEERLEHVEGAYGARSAKSPVVRGHLHQDRTSTTYQAGRLLKRKVKGRRVDKQGTSIPVKDDEEEQQQKGESVVERASAKVAAGTQDS